MSDNTPTREILKARDHSQPCPHRGAALAVQYRKDDPRWYTCPDPSCPGGREIVLRRDYEPVKVRWPCTDKGLSDEFWAVRVPHDGKWFVVEVPDE